MGTMLSPITLEASAIISPYRVVALDLTGAKEVRHAVVSDDHMWCGFTQEGDTYAVADSVAVTLKQDARVVELEASKAISADTRVYTAAAGKISDASAGSLVGIALKAASGDGSVIEVLVDVNARSKDLGFLNFPIGAWTEQDGTALADFADGDSATPGWSAGDEGFGIRWNNKSTSDPISSSAPYPTDLDPTADAVLHVLAAKVGATIGDAVTFLVEAFENKVGALYDADADFGGTSSAMTGDATSKTVQEELLTLALANINGSPGALTLTLQPTDNTPATDDVIVFAVWLEYTQKAV